MSKNILIVEDNATLSEMYKFKLELEGYSVLIKSDGLAAITYLSNASPDLILLDILLPGITGFEFIEQMQKEDATFRDVPVIVFSNLNSEEDREKAHALCIRQFINKSESTVEEIALMIESVLDTYSKS